jgi:inorganic pyrophosphatase
MPFLGDYRDISDVPSKVLDRLKHYFLTYKDLPGEERDCYITNVRGIKDTHELIRLSIEDYYKKSAGLET